MDSVRVLAAVRAVAAARRLRRPGSPAELARFLDPSFKVTPTIRLLSDVAVRWVTEPDQKDVATLPPRTGKSELLSVWTPVWALMPDPAFPMKGPDMQIVMISHSDDLAQELSGKARKVIREHADFLGFRIAPDKTAVGRWKVDGAKGGMLAAGINSGVVGFGADLLILDDVVKDAAQADSAAHRKRILNEYRGSLATRVHPGGSTLIVMTRWHEKDLAGTLLEEEPDVWRRTNIPAVSERGVPDALRRPVPGIVMVSALGFPPEHFHRMRRTVGERVWYAQYEGVPSAPTGNLIKQEWFDVWRLPAAPLGPVKTVVGVDPSDSGEGDEAGIVAASLTSAGVSAMIADVSAPMTSDAWAKAAVKLAAAVGASEIAVEAFAARATYTRVLSEEINRATAAGELRHAVVVTAWPPKGTDRGKGDAFARSAALLQAIEVGSLRLAGVFDRFEQQAITWQAGQHQPDRLAALVVAHDILVHSVGQEWGISTPAGAFGGASSSPQAAGQVVDMGDWMRQRVG